jgi:uncharacterized repeat protein (TIGR03803 family)
VKTLARNALVICSAAAWLAGCGGLPVTLSQTQGMGAQGLRATTSSFQVLYRFGQVRGGENPSGNSLLDVGTTLYGTTSYGGRGGNGVVYSITTTGAKKVLYSFRGYQHGDGTRPIGGVIDVNGTLYGTTEYGGHCDAGTVYALSTTGKEIVLHNFCYSSGGNVIGGLIDVNGTLYGTTVYGGSSNHGTVYSLSTSGGFKTLYSFKGGTDGVEPGGNLVAVNGVLFGVTFGGGSACSYGSGGCGIVYSLTTSGEETVLHAFRGPPDGAIPAGGLIDVNGTLYGTTSYGGIAPGSTKGDCRFFGCGTVYSIGTSGSENVLYRFRGGSHGANPAAALVETNRTLYGALTSGGDTCGSGTQTFGCGMLFSMTTRGTSEQTLHKFTGSDGAVPNDLIDVNNVLYGTTNRGGRTSACNGGGCGAVFSLTP